MAKYERHLTGDFDSLLKTLDDGILRGAATSFQDGSDYIEGNVRCAVRVYERYSLLGKGRMGVNITLIGNGNKLFLSLISSGGSTAVFFKINTWSEQAFAGEIIDLVDRWVQR
ncbi:MAG: DUF6054 family protein [Oscillospiraceae bacterium]|nr:DUF6054 family protein [Oscillospiraceae bacterium]